MANYNTFLVMDCKARKCVLTTSSARKADTLLKTGTKVEVWNGNQKVETIYGRDKLRDKNPLRSYIEAERDFIRKKQETATQRNQRGRSRASA